MTDIYFIYADKRTIEGREFYRITVLDKNNLQIFSFYRAVDSKSTSFVNSCKLFDEISTKLTFIIKRNNKISFDIK